MKRQPRKLDHPIGKLKVKESYFVDRTPVIANLTAFLESNSPWKEPRRVALVGMGGIGKTQIALDYSSSAWQRKVYRTCLWINASSTGTILASYKSIARSLFSDFPSAGLAAASSQENRDVQPLLTDPQQLVEMVTETFSQWTEPYLLIYDNLDDGEIQIMDYLPTDGPAAVLFTSRRQDLEQTNYVEQAIPVPLLDCEQGFKLLTNRLGQRLSQSVEREKVDAELFIERLGYLPLSIAQTAAYIAASGLSLRLSDYLQHFVDQRNALLANTPSFFEYTKIIQKDGKEFQSSLNVFATCEISLHYLIKSFGPEKEDDACKALEFLTICGYFDHRRISQVMFEKHLDRNATCQGCKDTQNWSSIFTDSQDRFNQTLFYEIIRKLVNLSLISEYQLDMREPQTFLSFSVHPLIQDWTIFRNSSQQRQIYCAEASQILNDAVLSVSDPEIGFSELFMGKIFCGTLVRWLASL